MGEESFQNVANLSLAIGILRVVPGDSGQGNGTETIRFPRPSTSPGTYGQRDTDTAQKRTKYSSEIEAKAKRAAYRGVHVALENLRLAAKAALEQVEAAKRFGVCHKDVTNAMRLEHTDWDKYIPDMQIASELLEATGARTSLDMLVLVDEPIGSIQDKYKDALQQGYFDKVIGKKIEDGAYLPGSPLYDSYIQGHKKASKDIKRDEKGWKVLD